MVNRLMMAQSAAMMGRWRSSAVVTLAALATVTAMTIEAAPRPSRPASPPWEVVTEREAGEPIMAIVSIQSQKVTFFDADGWVLRAQVSTGTTGRETPAGIFAVLEKEKEHHSSMYDDASMPNMQRITWNGIAMHGGPLPGYAASHGCVRLPYGFAEKLYDKTRIGMRVIISPNDAAPMEFSHPTLFSPNDEAIAAIPARVEALGHEALEAAKAVDEAKKSSAALAREVASLKVSLRNLERNKRGADGQLVSANKALTAANQAKERAEAQQQKAAAKAAEQTTQLDNAKAEESAKAAAAAANVATPATETAETPESKAAAKKAAAAAAREAASRTAALRKLEALKGRADAELAHADKVLAAADQAKTRAEDQQQKATAKAAELATQLDSSKTELDSKVAAAAVAKDGIKTAQARKAATAKGALDARLALEPVSVYISRATQKLYVRRNTHKPAPDGGGEVFDTSIEVPVTIQDPERPIGTHIFTAMARNETGLRWSAVTIDDGDSASAALDRISFPQDVLERIAPTALPRSSIIISDEPLSAETNYRTEFVAVLGNHPQGGFITRKPSVVPLEEKEEEGGFFFTAQPNQSGTCSRAFDALNDLISRGSNCSTTSTD